jgi:hypothetical protein
MSDQANDKQAIGLALALLAEKPRPERDGFRLAVSREDVDAPPRYVIERHDAALTAASDNRVSEVSD